MGWKLYILWLLFARAGFRDLLTTTRGDDIDNVEYTVLSLRRQMKAREVRSIHIMRTKLIYKAANV